MKKLEEIMDHYTLKDEDIIEQESLSSDEKQRILQKTIAKAEIVKIPTKLHRKRMTILVAACITVLALGAVSFAATTLSGNLLNFFHPRTQDEMNLLNSLGTVIDKQVSNNGLIIDVKEALGDSNAVYVMFDIIAPEGTILDKEQYTFVSQMIDLEKDFSIFGATSGMGYSFESMEDVNPNDNIKPMMLCLSSSENLVGKNMTFRFKDFSSYKTEEELQNRPESFQGTPGDENDVYNILIPGNWDITFPLDYTDNTVSYKLNQKLEYKDISFKVKEVRLSPISISMTLSSIDINSQDIINTPLIIHMKNGESVNANDGNRGANSSNFKTVVDAQFNKIVNPSDIESIEYCGTLLPIKL